MSVHFFPLTQTTIIQGRTVVVSRCGDEHEPLHDLYMRYGYPQDNEILQSAKAIRNRCHKCFPNQEVTA